MPPDSDTIVVEIPSQDLDTGTNPDAQIADEMEIERERV